jgi:hypothetical protein
MSYDDPSAAGGQGRQIARSPFQCAVETCADDELTPTEWVPAQPGEVGRNWDALERA